MTQRFYSQFGEDRALAKIFGDVRDGFCVEIGANDGVNDSNTYYFEKLGWECVLVEPNPTLCRCIRETRRAQLFECAASDKSGTALLNIADGPGRAHGVSSLGDQRKAASRIAAFGFTSRELTVQTRTLDDLLCEAGISRDLGFISIDVEGHELEVLKGFSIEKWRPTIIIVEDNSNFEDRSVVDHLHRCGYVPFRRTGVNDWYAHRLNGRLITAMSVAAWRWESLRARARARLRRVPGLSYAVHKIRGQSHP